MARVWFDGSGAILRFVKTDAEELLVGAPAGATGSVYFDEDTNPTALSDLNSNWNAHDCVGGVLRKNAVAVSLNASTVQSLQARSKTAGAIRLQADRSNNTTSYADVTGLGFQLEANASYAFSFDGAYSAAAGTTGLQLALNGPAFSFLAAGFEIATSTTAWLSAMVGAYNTGANATGSGGATLLPFHVYGNITTTEAGLLVVRFRSEVAASAVTIKQGSYGLLTKVG